MSNNLVSKIACSVDSGTSRHGSQRHMEMSWRNTKISLITMKTCDKIQNDQTISEKLQNYMLNSIGARTT